MKTRSQRPGAEAKHKNRVLTLQAFNQKGRHQVYHFQKERLFEDAMFSREAFVAWFSRKHHGHYESGVLQVQSLIHFYYPTLLFDTPGSVFTEC